MNYRLKKYMNGQVARTTSSVILDPPDDTSGMELGMEVALTLFEQLEHPLVNNQKLDVFYDSIRNITHTEALLVIESVNGEARIVFSHFDLEKRVTEDVCSKKGFYSKLADIRFTHFYQAGSEKLTPPLPDEHPPVSSLLAVPTKWQGETTGCLAVVNRIGDEALGQKDAMILSLAAMIVSFARDYKSTKEKPGSV